MIWTSYFNKYTGNEGLSVANSTPAWHQCKRSLRELMPDNVPAYKRGDMTWKEFRKVYIRKLKKLDVHKYAELLQGRVLLCHEKPRDHCHRKILIEWFDRNGYECGELEAEHENCTCLKCKYADGEFIPLDDRCWVCRKHGDAMTRVEAMCKTCDDWRYFA